MRERWERRVSGAPCVSRQLWHTYVSGTWLLRILAHDRWIQVLHLLHSIMARPAKGFMQKHVTRSHESSSEKRGQSTRRVKLGHSCQTCDNVIYAPTIKKPYPSLPWCPRPLLIHLHLGTPPVSLGGTPFCFLKSPPPSVPLPPLLQCFDHQSIDAPPWAPPCNGLG